jgi:(2Fe-2S) ferredoxin
VEYPFDKLFLVCNGPRCNNLDRGDERGEPIQKELKAHNKAMGRKPTVRVCATSCFDMCDHGPNMVVEPGHTIYSHLTRQSVKEAYAGEMGDGPRRTDLELTEEEFNAGSSASAKKGAEGRGQGSGD